MGSGHKHREEQARKRLSIVQDELLLLEAGTNCMRCIFLLLARPFPL